MAFETIAPAVARCAHSGVAFVRVEVDGATGVPTNITVTRRPDATTFCIERAVGELRMFPFGERFSTVYPFRLGWEPQIEAMFRPVGWDAGPELIEEPSDPNELNVFDANRAIKPVQDAVYRDCAGTERVIAAITVDGLSGKVTSVDVPNVERATADCVSERLRKAQFRKVDDDRTFDLRFPFRLREP